MEQFRNLKAERGASFVREMRDMESLQLNDSMSLQLKKYYNNNYFHKLAINRFFEVVTKELRNLPQRTVLEFGCGEGLFLKELRDRGVVFDHLVGVDLRESALEYARRINPNYVFMNLDILRSGLEKKSFDLVIASEVLEHLQEPASYLSKLVDLSRGYLFLTVPWEPWFQLMNFLRGRNVRRFGNHPEHVQHWGPNTFKNYVAQFAQVKKVLAVFPFIILVGEVPNEDGMSSDWRQL
jgi:2-polyprenyl-3-methyl-5-hydroxy-6-metoxy-1,4-benzoquinol methylase